jgi:plastocyanin
MADSAAVLATIAGFQHTNLTVSVGDTVTWTNLHNTAHTVTYFTEGNDTPLFQSGNFGTDGTFSHTFDTAGNLPYFCEIHPWMVGVITVGPGSASTGVADTGGDPGY